MTLSPSSQRRMVAMLALLGSVTQAHGDAPAPTTGTSTFIAPPDAAQTGSGAALPRAPLPQIAPRLSEPTPPKPRPEDAKILLAILRNQKVCNQKVCKLPLDLEVKNATLEEIAARVQKLLPPTAPKIEVRAALPIRLSFALKNSTVREVLESSAAIANAKLWVLPDRLLLAPATALPTAGGLGNASSNASLTSFVGGGGNNLQRVFASLIADELTAKLSPNAQGTPQGTGLSPSTETTFDKLSPEAQEMLQGLVDEMNGPRTALTPGTPTFIDFTLSPTTVVQLNGEGHITTDGLPHNTLKIKEGRQSMGWSTDGNGAQRTQIGLLPSKSGPTTPTIAPLDPSAKKS